MCGGGGSASNDDEKQNQTAVFKKNDNPMTGYNPGDIVQERLDPVGNPTQAPKNYPGTNIAKGTTNLMTNTNGSNDRSDTAKDNRVSGALLEQGARTAMYMANPMLGLGVDVARGVIGFLNPESKIGTPVKETAYNVLTGPIGGKSAGAMGLQNTFGKMALGADMAYGLSRAREVGMKKAMEESPRFSQNFVGTAIDNMTNTNRETGTTKSKDIGTIGTNNIIGTTKNDINYPGFSQDDDNKRRQGFGKGVYTRF